jgi:hypothetical protein
MPIPDAQELVKQVQDELLNLRSMKGRLTPQKLGRCPTLLRVTGADDLLDAFFAFRRELRRYIETGNRDEAAAALSIYADHDTVLDRLQETADQLSDRDQRDQRSARRWSDDGMPTIARDLVYMADVQGRLGRELLNIQLGPTDDGGLLVIIDQMVQTQLPTRAPELSLWIMDTKGDPEELSLDLSDYPAVEATRDDYRMIRQRVRLTPDLLRRLSPEHGLTLAVAERDAPMRTISFEPPTTPIPGIRLAFSAYRTRAAIELTRE